MSDIIIEQETRLVIYYINGAAEDTKEKLNQEKINEIMEAYKAGIKFKFGYAFVNPDAVMKIEPLTESVYQDRIKRNITKNNIMLPGKRRM